MKNEIQYGLDMNLGKHKETLFSLIVPIIILLGLALRFMCLLNRGSFVFDEYFAILYSRDLADLKNIFVYENNPPLYFLLVHFWQKILPVSEINARLLPFLFSLLQLPASYYLAWKIGKKRGVAWGAVVLTAVSPLFVFFASFGRMYSLLPLLGTIFFILLLSKASLINQIGLIVTGIALSLTHLFGPILLFSGVAVKALIRQDRQERKRIFWQTLLMLVPFLAWLGIQLPSRSVEDLNQGWYLFTRINPGFFIDRIVDVFSFGLNVGLHQLTSLILVTLAILLNFLPPKSRFSRQERERLLILAGGVLFTPLVGMLLNLNVVTYYLGVAPLILVLVNYFIWKKRLASSWIFFCGLIFLMIFSSTLITQLQPQSCWDKAASYVVQEEISGEQVLVAPFFRKIMIDYYYQGRNEIGGVSLPVFEQDSQGIISGNWKKQYTEENIGAAVANIERRDGFLVVRERELRSGLFKSAQLVIPEMLRQGFVFDQAKHFACGPDLWVYHFRVENEDSSAVSF
jgi:hypothetical protein